MNEHWKQVNDRVSSKLPSLRRKYAGMYLLVCVQTHRLAFAKIGSDDQGGHMSAHEEFDRKYGTMAE